MPGDGEKEDAGGSSGRGKAFCFPELMCCLFACLGTNEKFSAGKPKPVRLQGFNDAYTQRVKCMNEHDKWRDQHGKRVTHITPEQSIQERVKEIDSRTASSPISYQQTRVVGICRNHIAPLLAKIVDKDGQIPTGKQVSDVQEALRVAYFNAMTGDNAPEPCSSEDEAGKADRAEAVSTARVSICLSLFLILSVFVYLHLSLSLFLPLFPPQSRAYICT